MKTSKFDKLQELCRDYLQRLSGTAQKYGLEKWLANMIAENKQGKCASTEEEVELLARILDDERLKRTEVPKVLGKSYRRCFENGDFDNIKKLRHVGIFSKISTLMMKENGRKE